jgi:hypothetical protein
LAVGVIGLLARSVLSDRRARIRRGDPDTGFS